MLQVEYAEGASAPVGARAGFDAGECVGLYVARRERRRELVAALRAELDAMRRMVEVEADALDVDVERFLLNYLIRAHVTLDELREVA
jgi:hypothetical protein